MITLYNTLSRQKEEFVPYEDDVVKIYSCGPTVYSRQHIGNLRAALFSDFLKKTLRLNQYEVIDVVNITDVGHLTSDSDEGEDKMLKAVQKEKKDPYEIARVYESIYIDDLNLLNITLPKHMPRATEHISQQIDIIKELEKKGYTYITSDGVYFDVRKFNEYGRLSGQSLEEKKSGASGRLSKETVSEKRNKEDFALWKFLIGDNKNHIMKWESPWGPGFPGWHLECSAMSSYYLGKQIDIHTGGIDHIPIHHENEIAQNTCSGCVDNVHFWMHNDFMRVDDEKMAKSKGNVYSLADIIEKGYSPLAFRELCLRTHYRKQINFTFESLESAEISVKRFNDFKEYVSSLQEISGDNTIYQRLEEYKKRFLDALNDDLNTPEALASVYECMNEVYRKESLSKEEKEDVLSYIIYVNNVIGLLHKQEEIPNEVVELAQKRKEFKEKKNFEKADEIREIIREKGWEIKDSKESEKGYILTKRK